MEDPTHRKKQRSRRRRKPDGSGPGGGGQSGANQGGPGRAQRPSGQRGKAPARAGGAPAQKRSAPKGQLPPNLVYGVNPVGIALEIGQLKTLYYDKTKMSERMQHIHAHAQTERIDIQPIHRQGWSRVLPAELHQGVAGMLMEQPRYYLEEIMHEVGDDSCILVLDQVQDPQNLGAVLRTAAATGVDAVVLPKAGGCPLTPAVHKASAGMSLKMRVVEDENLTRAIDYLKDHGYWVIGCDSGAGECSTTFEYPRKRVIVMGNEAEGMRQLVREHCDYLVKIPMAEGVESLNISVATGIVLYLAKADLARAEHDGEHENGENGEAAVENSEMVADSGDPASEEK